MMEGAGFSVVLFTACKTYTFICGLFNGAVSSSGYSKQHQTVGLAVNSEL
jgi:hypothetical protein